MYSGAREGGGREERERERERERASERASERWMDVGRFRLDGQSFIWVFYTKVQFDTTGQENGKHICCWEVRWWLSTCRAARAMSTSPAYVHCTCLSSCPLDAYSNILLHCFDIENVVLDHLGKRLDTVKVLTLLMSKSFLLLQALTLTVACRLLVPRTFQ